MPKDLFEIGCDKHSVYHNIDYVEFGRGESDMKNKCPLSGFHNDICMLIRKTYAMEKNNSAAKM